MKPRRTLLRARQLAVVGVELLVQDEEAADLAAGEALVGGEVGVDLLDAVAHELEHLGLLRQVGVAAVRQVALLGPVADRLDVDVDERADLVAPVAEGHRFLDVREELQLVLDVLGREQRAVVGAADDAADVLGAVDDLQVAARVEEAGVAGVVPAVGVEHLGGRCGVLVVLLEQPGRAHQHLAGVGDPDLDAFDRHADGVGAHLVVGLQADEDGGLGRAVELLQVDADRAVEGEQVRADRLARGVGDAHAREAERVAQRRVDEQVAERVAQPVERADAAGRPCSAGPTRRASAMKRSNSQRLGRAASSMRIITLVSRPSKTRGGAK